MITPDRLTLAGALRAFWASMVLHCQLYLATSARVMHLIFMPIMMAFLAILLLKDAPNGSAVFYPIVGVGLGSLWSQLLGIATFSIHWQRGYGTLEMLVSSPTPLVLTMTGYLFAEVLMGLAAMVVSMGLAFATLGRDAVIASPGLFAGGIAVGIFGFLATGVLISSVMTVSRTMIQWLNALDYPMWILAGFMFPAAVLPNWLLPLSYLLPPYWTAKALQDAASGAPTATVVTGWAATLLLALLYFLLAVPCYRLVLRRIRHTAEIAL